jgi:phosphate starvation-inducible protein PhoH
MDLMFNKFEATLKSKMNKNQTINMNKYQYNDTVDLCGKNITDKTLISRLFKIGYKAQINTQNNFTHIKVEPANS